MKKIVWWKKTDKKSGEFITTWQNHTSIFLFYFQMEKELSVLKPEVLIPSGIFVNPKTYSFVEEKQGFLGFWQQDSQRTQGIFSQHVTMDF